MYLKLIEAENDLDEIMAYVRANPGTIETYAGRLAERFKDEVNEIYQQHIRSVARSSSNRNDYKKACGILSRNKKIAGSAHQKEMIEELRTLYIHRPAFVDELSKIL